MDLEENKKYDKGNRDQLNQVDWAELMPQLFKYARIKTNYNRIRNGDIILDPEDITMESIASAYGIGKDFAYRNWNKDKYLDPKSFIMSIIDSIINHKLQYLKKLVHNPVSLDDPNGPYDINNLCHDDIDFGNPEKLLERNDELKNIYTCINDLCKDDKEIMLILSALYDGVYTPKLISEETNIGINDVYRIMKKLRRRVRPLYNQLFHKR
ncbi:MAG: sigma-70 family RNA polymerase sigma factor [Thermodesulfobacteriota bacterium]